MPGALSAVAALAEATGAALAWVPRRAGERGAVEAGALPGLLAGGRPVADAAARADVATAWGVDSPAVAPGRDTAASSRGAHRRVRALLVGGVDPDDLPDPTAALAAIDAAPFVVSLELRASAVTERADVVLPVAPVVEKAGTFVDWEGRGRPFAEVLRGTNAMPDVRVLHVLAAAMDVDLALPDVDTARAEIAELGDVGRRAARPSSRTRRRPPDRASPGRGSPGHLAAAARRRPPAGRRAVPRRHRQAARRPALGRHRRAASASPTATRSRSAPTAAGVGAGGARRDAGRRRVAADQQRLRARPQ